MCDQVSDAILDALLREDPRSKVACGECCHLLLHELDIVHSDIQKHVNVLLSKLMKLLTGYVYNYALALHG